MHIYVSAMERCIYTVVKLIPRMFFWPTNAPQSLTIPIGVYPKCPQI
jgi:hypothetical protein